MRQFLFALVIIAIVVPASGQTLIVANKAEATASLLDLETAEVVATVPTGEGPHEVAVSPDGRTAVITDYGVRGAAGNSLTVVDVPTAEVVRTVDLGEHTRPHGMRWLDGERMVVTAEGSGSLLVVNIATGEVEQAIATDQDISHMVAITADGSRAFVANIGSSSVTVVDVARGVVLKQLATGDGAEGVDVTPDGRQVWVTNRAEDTVSVVDADTLETLAKLDSPSFPIRAMAAPDGKHVLVTGARSDDVTVFSTDPPAVARRIAFELDDVTVEDRLFGDRFGDSSVPIGIAISPDGGHAFVAHANGDVISVIDLETWEVTGRLKAGKEPDGMGVSPWDVKRPDQG